MSAWGCENTPHLAVECCQPGAQSFRRLRVMSSVVRLLALLAVLGMGACATDDKKAGPPKIVDASVTLAAGAVLEGTWNGGLGDSLSFVFAMNNPVLDWDVHTHDGNATQTYIVEFAVANASYTLDPSHETSWYVLVKNSGSASENLQAELALSPGTTWSGWP